MLDKYEQALLEINRLCLELSVDPHGPPSILSLCDDSLLMARQLTHIEVVGCHGYNWVFVPFNNLPLSVNSPY